MKIRGLTSVVTIVLLILLGILLVALLWIMISAFLKGKNPDISSFNTELRIDTVCVNSAKNVSVLVKKIRADDTLNGFYLAVYDSNGNANSTFFNENFKNSISGWFNIDKTQHGFDSISKIGITPIFLIDEVNKTGILSSEVRYNSLDPRCIYYDPSSGGGGGVIPPGWSPGLGAPSSLAVTKSGANAQLSWQDNSGNFENGFYIQRATGACTNTFIDITVTGANVASYLDNSVGVDEYCYRVKAFNATANS